MPIDLQKDSRRWRALLLVCAVGLLIVFVVVGLSASSRQWRALQDGFGSLAKNERWDAPGIQQVVNCSGQIDRCTTCHLGVEREDLRDESLPKHFRAHPAKMLHHQSLGVGCSACHGGTGRALTVVDAHAMPGTKRPDPRMKEPNIQASCAQCHVPGAVPGMERLVRGSFSYVELGCVICHPLTRDGRGGYDYGPDLRAIGQQDLAYLKASLVDPTANFADSTMPTFERTFENRSELLDDMLIFLQSLVLQRQESCGQQKYSARMLMNPCANCHAGKQGRAQGRFEHRCTYILENRELLQCGRCHLDDVPEKGAGNGTCPFIAQQREACFACH